MKSSTIISVLFLICIGFAGLLYWTLKTKVQEVSNQEPFTEIINKKLVLDRDVLIVKNRDASVFEHPLLIVEQDAVLDEEIKEKRLLKAGTPLTLTNAKLFKNGTSGFTTSVVFGTVFTDEGELDFEHIWGDEHVSFSIDEPSYYTFLKPIWQGDYVDFDKDYFFNN